MKSSLLICLIHNNNQDRNFLVRKNIDSLVEALSNFFLTHTTEVSYQKKIAPHNMSMALFRRYKYQLLEHRWRAYRDQGKSLLLFLYNFIKAFYKDFLYRNPDRCKNSSAIEVIVTDKHIRAWDQFLESDSDYFLVLEDDVIFVDDSIDRFCRLLKKIQQYEEINALYVDLAGGVSSDELGIEKLTLTREEGLIFYQKPVTNTACAYLVNRTTVSQFREILMDFPSHRLIGVDWMMNQLFIDMVKSSQKVICIHSDVPIFRHGSASGAFSAWER
jgi:hypothetical protein